MEYPKSTTWNLTMLNLLVNMQHRTIARAVPGAAARLPCIRPGGRAGGHAVRRLRVEGQGREGRRDGEGVAQHIGKGKLCFVCVCVPLFFFFFCQLLGNFFSESFVSPRKGCIRRLDPRVNIEQREQMGSGTTYDYQFFGLQGRGLRGATRTAWLSQRFASSGKGFQWRRVLLVLCREPERTCRWLSML